MQYRTSDIIQALEKTHGLLYLAAEVLGCAPSTIYRRADKDAKIRETIEKYRGLLIDKAELKLENAVMAGEPWAVQFTLRTIGKNRGYVERQELGGENGLPITVVIKQRPDGS